MTDKRSNQIPRQDLLFIIALFFIAHGLMLLNGGIFLDDWTLFHVSRQAIANTFHEAGAPTAWWIHMVLHNHPFFYRGLTFISLLLASVYFYKILLFFTEIKRVERLFLTLCFFLFPVNFAKIAAICFPSIFFLFLFILSTYFLLNYLSSHKKVYYVLALATFFFSFSVSSMLVLYAAVLLLIAYHQKNSDQWPSLILKLKAFAPFIVLPFIYWLVKTIWLNPSGLFKGYNQIEVGNIINLPKNIFLTIYNNLMLPLMLPWKLPLIPLLIPFGFIIFIFLYIYFKKNYVEAGSNFRFFCLGLFLYFLAVFPYLAIGRPGDSFGHDWNSRDQLLVPFGAAFIILYGSVILTKKFKFPSDIRLFFLSVILAGFTTTQISYYLMFQREWFRELALIENFRENEVIQKNTTFLVEDDSDYISGYTSRFYVYNGMMKYAFGDEKRFAVDRYVLGATSPGAYIDEMCKRFRSHPEYNMSQYFFSQPVYLITIRPGQNPLELQDVFHRTLMQWYNRDKFWKLTKKMISVELSPLSP